MMPTRLAVLRSTAVLVVMILNCGVAVAGPKETSADYFMPGCRDAASLITFSVRESEEEAARMNFCAGIVVGLSFMGELHGICVPPDTTSQQALSYSTSTDGLRGLTRTFALLPLRLCEQAGRVLQAIRAVGNPSPGKRAQIGGEIRRGGADRQQHRQAAGAVGQVLNRIPTVWSGGRT